jgi:hypothetical protein
MLPLYYFHILLKHVTPLYAHFVFGLSRVFSEPPSEHAGLDHHIQHLFLVLTHHIGDELLKFPVLHVEEGHSQVQNIAENHRISSIQGHLQSKERVEGNQELFCDHRRLNMIEGAFIIGQLLMYTDKLGYGKFIIFNKVFDGS